MDTLLTKPRCFVFSFKCWDTNRTEQNLCRVINSDGHILKELFFGFETVKFGGFVLWGFFVLISYPGLLFFDSTAMEEGGNTRSKVLSGMVWSL